MPSGAQALKEVQIIRFSHLKHGSLTSSRWAMPIVYKGLVHAEDTKAGHTEIFMILQQKKHGFLCNCQFVKTQLTLFQWYQTGRCPDRRACHAEKKEVPGGPCLLPH